MSNPTSGLGFGQFVPGFEFLQNLVTPSASAGQGMGSGMPNLGSWVAPTFNVEDLEKRIEELKAVHFWLEQNSKALGATIQAMEVQKMTLATLRDLNVNFGDIAKAGEAASSAAAASVSKGFAGFDMPSAPAVPVEPAPQARREADPPSAKRPSSAKAKAKAIEGAASGNVDAVQWWGALQQQFQNIAVNAMQDLAKQSPPTAAQKARGEKPAAKPVAKKAAARQKATPRSKAR